MISSDPAAIYRSAQGPAWRWKLAHERAASRHLRCTDEAVEQAARFLRLLMCHDGDELQLAQECPAIIAARSLWDHRETRQTIKILTLGSCSRELIAKRLSAPVEIIKTAEMLFFDVRDYREAKSWINGHVFRADIRDGAADLAVKCRMALWGGPDVAQGLLDAEMDVPVSHVKRIADQEILLHVRLQQALAIPLDSPSEGLRLVRMWLDYDHRKKCLELLKQKLLHRCEQDVQKNELANRRFEAVTAREGQRFEAKRQRAERRRQKREEQAALAEEHARLQEEQRREQGRLAQQRREHSPLARLLWKKSGSCASTSHEVASKMTFGIEDEFAVEAEAFVIDADRQAVEMPV